MITFINSQNFTIDSIDTLKTTSSTLLIPKSLYQGYLEKKLENGNKKSVYLRNLLWMFKTITRSGLIPEPRRLKTEYQAKDQNLVKVSFRPYNDDWIELGELALAFGKSRCWMFVYLLELDILGLWDLLVKFSFTTVVPTNSNLCLKSSWIISRIKRQFTREYYIRI